MKREQSTQPQAAAQPETGRRFSALLAVVVAAVLAIGFLGAITSLIVWLADRRDTGPEVSLSLQFVAAVVLLILVICILAIVYRRLGMDDPTRAMGLPDGSIRAIIALLLIVLFFLAAVFLFESTQDRPDATVRRSLEGVTSERLAGIPTEQILSLSSRTEGSTTVYDVELSQAPTNTPQSNDIAKQLITVVGTLVTAVAAFYFGASSVGAASSRAYRDTTLALMTPAPGSNPSGPPQSETPGPPPGTTDPGTGATVTAADVAAEPPTPPPPETSAPTSVTPSDEGLVTPLDLDDPAVGDLEAEQEPEPVPDAPYVEDTAYDPANDAIDPDTRGESDDADTPGAAGPPPDPSAGGDGI